MVAKDKLQEGRIYHGFSWMPSRARKRTQVIANMIWTGDVFVDIYGDTAEYYWGANGEPVPGRVFEPQMVLPEQGELNV